MSGLVYLVLSGIAGAATGGVRAAHLPYAPVPCTLAALIVSVTVSLPLGDKGPHLAEVAVLPATAAALFGGLLMRLVLQAIVRRVRVEA